MNFIFFILKWYAHSWEFYFWLCCFLIYMFGWTWVFFPWKWFTYLFFFFNFFGRTMVIWTNSPTCYIFCVSSFVSKTKQISTRMINNSNLKLNNELNKFFFRWYRVNSRRLHRMWARTVHGIFQLVVAQNVTLFLSICFI